MINRRNALALLASCSLLPINPASAEKTPPADTFTGFNDLFREIGTVGSFAALRNGKLIVNDNTRVREAILPASTYKIPHSIIAIETGVVSDPDKDVFKWDGIRRGFEDWNQDHTLRSAIAASAVPVYQQIAHNIGHERMQKNLDALQYGNQNTNGGIDHFWLSGDLRISPLQQIDFLERLHQGTLPVSRRSQDLTLDILPVIKVGSSIIRAKSGLVGVDDRRGIENATVGWLTGYAETGSAMTIFALNVDILEKRHVSDRAKLAERCLAAIDSI
ncbi:penicillin-binding transpeptidase domain-containing protein [Phyllobacterium sp. SB3]|uniref:penicillin-binding transpeptidase domain-containing protein n=1 Tax=Phyllobacterium sp. SB3 TaxID=3156073 RepID=UPI0032AE9501